MCVTDVLAFLILRLMHVMYQDNKTYTGLNEIYLFGK